MTLLDDTGTGHAAATDDPAVARVRFVAPRLAGQPVVVVGAGPVGTTTALLLARWGIDVILLDSRQQREPVGSPRRWGCRRARAG